ncbi:hypothetical protein FACS1894132_01080 [Clostridia bacterium]|nr:hypothetical protein FACS1894132_01080 [Clostridia bacterium]
MIYLIDYENVHNSGLKGIDKLTKKDKVIVFFDVLSKIDFQNIIMNIEFSNARAKWIKVDHTGYKNVLDFQLSTYIGYLIGKEKSKEFVIVSKDCGYQAIINFWKQKKKKVRIVQRPQIANIIQIASAVPTVEVVQKPVKKTKSQIQLENIKAEIEKSTADLAFTEVEITDIYNRFLSNNKIEIFKSGLITKYKDHGSSVYERLEKFFCIQKGINFIQIKIEEMVADLGLSVNEIRDIYNRFFPSKTAEIFKNSLKNKFKERGDAIYERVEKLFCEHKNVEPLGQVIQLTGQLAIQSNAQLNAQSTAKPIIQSATKLETQKSKQLPQKTLQPQKAIQAVNIKAEIEKLVADLGLSSDEIRDIYNRFLPCKKLETFKNSLHNKFKDNGDAIYERLEKFFCAQKGIKYIEITANEKAEILTENEKPEIEHIENENVENEEVAAIS